MAISKASGSWSGSVKSGSGTMHPEHAEPLKFSLKKRIGEESGSSPEELMGAALCGCFSMALAAALEREDLKPERISTRAEVTLSREEVGLMISSIALHTQAKVDGVDPVKFEHLVRETKETCPVAKALLGVMITTEASLVS